ncbi:MAG: SoxR reducing system RseC family protein [Rhodobacterales bacterium]|nr:SoxR reducing system RseC family protein [Rhodobacterales bacterium]
MSEPTRPEAAAAGDRILLKSLRVVAVREGWACLESPRGGACASCSGTATCAGAALARLSGPRRTWLPVRSAPVPVGSRVDVALDGGAFVRASVLAYLLPPAGLAVAAALAAAAGLSDGATALLCLAVLPLTLVPARLAERGGGIWHRMQIQPPPSRQP